MPRLGCGKLRIRRGEAAVIEKSILGRRSRPDAAAATMDGASPRKKSCPRGFAASILAESRESRRRNILFMGRQVARVVPAGPTAANQNMVQRERFQPSLH